MFLQFVFIFLFNIQREKRELAQSWAMYTDIRTAVLWENNIVLGAKAKEMPVCRLVLLGTAWNELAIFQDGVALQ